ncbi:SMI1/KNR4 family protein [Streptacidiphilus jiangxiensis]|uniref:A nuclease of the HNH/ENDO VII superfamily with conserved WHH n=1 Tax=Streptacidiphilus jiangxiensis TaxID=235985 RepID=A0A1H7FJI2_STRJI|nr:SMI1/KNR4 family protein [Streptacidiphilus jiangxiensis]SEK24592.1 A nuclease of the HNH/ENDO VII superfamily with conserved WHH [Streptacidiphilus jiangxiensis]
MTTGRPNGAYAGQVVQFPDPLRAQQYPSGVRIDAEGRPDFSPYARAAAEIADPPEGFGVDELRLTDYVSANAALRAEGHELWADVESPVGTPAGWTWHHSVTPATPGSRRLELIPVEVKALLRHHAGLAGSRADHAKRGTRPLQERRPVHFALPGAGDGAADASQAGEGATSGEAAEHPSPLEIEQRLQTVEEALGYTLPGPYRIFLKAAGGRAPKGLGLDTELGILVDQPFFGLPAQRSLGDLAYINKCLRDHVTKDYLGIGFAQGGLLVIKVRGERIGTVWFLPYDDARDDADPSLTPQQRCERLLLPCGDDFDAFLLRLAGSPPELQTVAELMVDGGFARAVPVKG